MSLQPHFLFSFLGFTYVGAMVASNTALSFITYPTQVRQNDRQGFIQDFLKGGGTRG